MIRKISMKNVLIFCEFRENLHSGTRTLLKAENKFLSLFPHSLCGLRKNRTRFLCVSQLIACELPQNRAFRMDVNEMSFHSRTVKPHDIFDVQKASMKCLYYAVECSTYRSLDFNLHSRRIQQQITISQSVVSV
jgi:hypothetical protein